jgi:hypothetical protein
MVVGKLNEDELGTPDLVASKATERVILWLLILWMLLCACCNQVEGMKLGCVY